MPKKWYNGKALALHSSDLVSQSVEPDASKPWAQLAQGLIPKPQSK